MDGPWLIAGLGNPGPQYAGNRHNAGFMVVEVLAGRAGVTLRGHRSRAAVAEARIGIGPGGVPGPRVILAQPMTFMNLSGGPVSTLAQYYDIPVDRIIVIHDDVDLTFGTIKLKRGGGEGGHNGLRAITKALRTKEYLRVRVGVGRPPGRMDTADYVLRDFSRAETVDLPGVLNTAADAVQMVLDEGLLAAQGKFHTRV